jgi:hypothetical protein
MKLKDLLPTRPISYREMYENEKKSHAETIKQFLEVANKQPETKYTRIASFEVSDRSFIQKIAAIADSDEMTFMLYDLKQQCVENMVNGNVEVNVQMTGIIKGIDLVVKNLTGYKAMWKSMLAESNNVREI